MPFQPIFSHGQSSIHQRFLQFHSYAAQRWQEKTGIAKNYLGVGLEALATTGFFAARFPDYKMFFTMILGLYTVKSSLEHYLSEKRHQSAVFRKPHHPHPSFLGMGLIGSILSTGVCVTSLYRNDLENAQYYLNWILTSSAFALREGAHYIYAVTPRLSQIK